MVDSEHFVRFDFDCVCVSGAGESLEVLEGVGPVAEGEERESRAGEVHSGAEDEGSELRFVERATEWEEDEELECRDQVEANHLVLAESDHHLPCLLCRFVSFAIIIADIMCMLCEREMLYITGT